MSVSVIHSSFPFFYCLPVSVINFSFSLSLFSAFQPQHREFRGFVAFLCNWGREQMNRNTVKPFNNGHERTKENVREMEVIINFWKNTRVCIVIFEKRCDMVVCFNIGVEIVDFSKCKRGCATYWRALSEILSRLWNSSKNCATFSLKLREIFLKIDWNSHKN